MEKVDVIQEKISQPVQATARIGHSKLGIASFIIAMVSGVVFWGSIVIATAIEMNGASPSSVEIQNMILGFILIFIAFVNLVGTGLGIAGVMSKIKKRIFAILGIVFNLLTIIVFIFFMIIGLAMT